MTIPQDKIEAAAWECAFREGFDADWPGLRQALLEASNGCNHGHYVSFRGIFVAGALGREKQIEAEWQEHVKSIAVYDPTSEKLLEKFTHGTIEAEKAKQRLLCWLFGHKFYYIIHPGEPLMWRCMRCRKMAEVVLADTVTEDNAIKKGIR